MRQGQSTLEYALLIGIAAAGMIAVIFYVSRGHQGHLRSQADQLSARQYAPGKTNIHNWENKTLKSSVISSSSTTVKHSANPIGQINEPLQGDPDVTLPPPPAAPGDPVYDAAYAAKYGLIGQIGLAYGEIYEQRDLWEQMVAWVGADEALDVKDGEWPWVLSDVELKEIEDNLADAEEVLYGDEGLLADALDSAAGWPDREPDETLGSGTTTSETGTIDTTKQINESLGDL